MYRNEQGPNATTSRGSGDALPGLSGRARAILRTYFDEARALELPPGHSTVGFTEPQVYHLLRVLTDETLRMSYDTMEKMVLDAVREKPATAPSRTAHFYKRSRAATPYRGLSSDSSDVEEGGDPNVGTHGQDSTGQGEVGDSSSFGESDSAGEMALITAALKPGQKEDTQTHPDPDSLVRQAEDGTFDTDPSSQDITLSEVREQALDTTSKRKTRSKVPVRPKRPQQHGIPMREEFFAKIGWTRSFISGPADPVHNPHMVWCHVCKKNFLIETKGPFEILRHHRSERHLRRDQRWRYEHLRNVDPVTGKIQHRVRGRNGKLPTNIELAKELPKFIHAELVDLGERFPFYDDFIRGRTTPMITPESRARTQLNIVSDFLQTEGDLGTLRNLWARISSFTDHQAALCDFDWGEERVSVSTFPIGSHHPAQTIGFLILFSVSGDIPTPLQLRYERDR